MLGSRRANIVLPVPGEPIIRIKEPPDPGYSRLRRLNLLKNLCRVVDNYRLPQMFGQMTRSR